MRIGIGNGIDSEKNSIRLGDDTDAKIYRQNESTCVRIDDYVYEVNNEAYNQTQLDPNHTKHFHMDIISH